MRRSIEGFYALANGDAESHFFHKIPNQGGDPKIWALSILNTRFANYQNYLQRQPYVWPEGICRCYNDLETGNAEIEKGNFTTNDQMKIGIKSW